MEQRWYCRYVLTQCIKHFCLASIERSDPPLISADNHERLTASHAMTRIMEVVINTIAWQLDIYIQMYMLAASKPPPIEGNGNGRFSGIEEGSKAYIRPAPSCR